MNTQNCFQQLQIILITKKKKTNTQTNSNWTKKKGIFLKFPMEIQFKLFSLLWLVLLYVIHGEKCQSQ